ncbi:MAG TPA: preprotein translocase subunit SecG [Leucothrix mucor]|nr:preprotein translocase subunit SecG [Leucothrix mucor]
MIYNVLLIIQIIVALSIIGLVLMQHGKGADAGAAFGGGASGTVFGSRGSGNFLTRATGVLAAVFFANSLALAWLVSHRGDAFSDEQSVVPQAEVAGEVKSAPEAEAKKPPTPSDVPTSVGSPEKTEVEARSSENKDGTPEDVPK